MAGGQNTLDFLPETVRNDKKIEFTFYPQRHILEFSTLQRVHKEAIDNPNSYICYFHMQVERLTFHEEVIPHLLTY